MKLQSEYHRQLLLKAITLLQAGNVEGAIHLIERVLYEK